jgi:2-polyprenyl-3-methyl-5-hydroxy-6-metoxy-1,4-benzoquinol methylase
VVRYAWALPHCYRRSVLETGSQYGWGAYLISWVANSVTLTDISKPWMEYAMKQVYQCPVEFFLKDFEKEFVVGKWDTIVCFETIEHLEDPNFFLEQCSKSMTEKGRFLFSVPHMVENHEHKQVYDKKKISALISKYFTLEDIFEQTKEPITGNNMYGDLKCYVGWATKK